MNVNSSVASELFEYIWYSPVDADTLLYHCEVVVKAVELDVTVVLVVPMMSAREGRARARVKRREARGRSPKVGMMLTR